MPNFTWPDFSAILNTPRVATEQDVTSFKSVRSSATEHTHETIKIFCGESFCSVARQDSPHLHRRIRAIFWPGGGEPFAQKFSQVAQIFTKQSKRNEGHMMQ